MRQIPSKLCKNTQNYSPISDRRLKLIVFEESWSINRVFEVLCRFLDSNPILTQSPLQPFFGLSRNALSQIMFEQKEERDRLNFLLKFIFFFFLYSTNVLSAFLWAKLSYLKTEWCLKAFRVFQVGNCIGRFL